MDEQPTTGQEVQPTGAPEALPVANSPEPAAPVANEEPSKPNPGGSADPLPNEDDEKLASFAKGQGIEDLSDLTDRERSLLKSAYDNQAEFQRNRQKVSELEKNLGSASDDYAEQVAQQTGQDPELLKRLQRVEVKEAVRDFWNTPDANGNMPDRSLEPAMVELLNDKPHLAGDLDSLYATAMVKSGKFAAAKSQGKREALESLAQKQQAAVPTGNATNSSATPGAKPFEEMSIKEMEAHLGFVNR